MNADKVTRGWCNVERYNRCIHVCDCQIETRNLNTTEMMSSKRVLLIEIK